jgi:RimJ/RimL family protein N-acetyltransferase
VEAALDKSAIKTKRLILRHFKAEDAVALHPLFADPEAMRFWSSAPKSLAQTEEFVRDTIRASQAGTGDGFVVLFEGVVIGKAGLWRAYEIGFIFSRGVWGTGNCRRDRSRDYEPCFDAWRYLDYCGRGPTERAVPSAS